MDIIRNGVFASGKFSGQPLYAPHFWEMAQQGLADARDKGVYIFDLTSKDIEKFPELARYEVVRLHNDSKGFITVEPGFDDDL
jgi:hypothetical protein